MDIREAFPAKYLKSEDIGDRRVNVILDRCEMEQMPGDKVEIKPVLYFRGKDKGLVLNVTNTTTLEAAYGWDTDKWVGQVGVLFTVDVDFSGKRTKGIRIDATMPEPVAEPEPVPSGVDDLPF